MNAVTFNDIQCGLEMRRDSNHVVDFMMGFMSLSEVLLCLGVLQWKEARALHSVRLRLDMCAPSDRHCTMGRSCTALHSSATAGPALGDVERSRGVAHLEQRRSHGWGLQARCSPGAQSGAALPSGRERTLCMMPGQRWSVAQPLLGQCTLCFHPAVLKCACRDMPQ